MTVAPPLESTTSGGAVIELDEEIEAEEIGSRNYRFIKIGEPVPLKPGGADVEFEPQSIPSQALAVSERFRLCFVAHPEGFYVVRTKDVMASAEEIKEKKTGPSIQELSLVDVPIGKVTMLALSADDSLLAASVSSHVHFFAVSALLHKEQKPSYSVSLDDSSCIKDVRWARKVAKSYLILSSNGKLYHGSGQGPLTNVMDGVDSVDWSLKGSYIAVAKKSVVSILSSQFKEKIRFLLSFQTAIGDSDANQVIRVDSIRWIRPDSLAVGFFVLNDDGEEENYIIQVITSRGRRIADAGEASKPIVLSFNNVFMDFCSDAVPTRNGPHLFFNYLDLYGLAFVASKNLSCQVALFCWQDSEKNEAAMVEILDDAWTLYIDSQGNGDDNVIVGLSVDKVSQNQDLKFRVGNEESEVSPCCVIICETIDGMISVFHFASTAGALASPEGYDSGEEDDASPESVMPVPYQISSAGAEERRGPTFSTSQSYDLSRVGVEKTRTKATSDNDLSVSSNVDIRSREKGAPENMGHKPENLSETLKMDNPEKKPSVLLNQENNAENKSISEVNHIKGFLSGRVAGDVSRQSVNNYPLLGSNAEPLPKVSPLANTPSAWSLTRSNAKVDASKTSDGRLSSLPSDEVANLDKHAFRSVGGIQQHLTDLKEKPSVSFTSSGQAVLAAQGNRISQPAFVGSHMPGGNNSSLGKSSHSNFKKELNTASSPASMTHFAQSPSKQFGNVEEMAKKLDILLEGIEGKGGFRDASITSQTNSVIELEEGIWALSDRCRIQRGLMNEQQRELQLLLDKTVEVLVRKVYMEGIFKQATDSKYWELWNRQKLSSELELKRRNILELNQELTNKLIELERHFNSLEFNKFRESEGTQRSQRALQKWHGHSRQVQSLRSLHNTMTAQLAAAEQLSGCLSKQMAALRIESSGKHDVKRQIFESIGLAYDGDTDISPARKRTSSSPADKEYSSGSMTAKGQSTRNQASFSKGSEPETARRRRDSFDRSWASFDPPKTILKRMQKEDNEKGSSSRSFLNVSKQYLSPQSSMKSEVARSSLPNISGASQDHYKIKGYAEASAERFSESASTSLYHRTAEIQDRGVQMLSAKSFSMPPPPTLETRTTQNSVLGALRLADEKSKSTLTSTSKNYHSTSSGSVLVQQSDTSFHQLPSMSVQLPQQSLTSAPDSTESSDRFKFGFSKSTSWDQKNTKELSETTISHAKIPPTPTSAFSSDLKVSEKRLFGRNSEDTSRPNDFLSASSPLQSVPGSSLFSRNNYPSPASLVSKPNSSTILPATPKSSEASVVTKQEGSQSQQSVTSALTFPSTSPSLTRGSSSSVSSSSSIVNSESPTSSSFPSGVLYGSNTEAISEVQTKVDNMPSTETGDKTETSASQPEVPISTSLKLGPSALTTLMELSTNPKSESQDDIGGSLKNSSAVTSDIKVEMRSKTEVLPTAAVSSEGINGSTNTFALNSSHEEEMEEESPETNQTTEFGFANFGGFGIGSTQNSTTPNSNPFGVGVLNQNTTFSTSPFTMSAPSGELFRPASFNFQSPQPLQPLQPTTMNSSGGFSSGVPGQVSGAGGFGQPAQVGAGQQALGSVLGSFGQSRQIGTGLPGSNAAPASGFGSGFTGMSGGGFGGGFATAASGGGFAAAASGGGFAGLAAGGGGGGFASAAPAGGGFAAAATAGGGFAAAATAGAGFAGAASGGGGFGGFGNQAGSGGFSAFGSGSVAGRPSSQLFTQMRK